MFKISLEHQQLLNERFKRIPIFLSEYTFASIYLFRDMYKYELLALGDKYLIRGQTQEGQKFIMPTENLSGVDISYLLEAAKDIDFIYPIPKEWTEIFTSSGAEISFNKNDSDYVFKVERLSTYKGQKLHSKKNLLNQFLAAYKVQALPLIKERMADAFNILDAWQADMGEEKNKTDYFNCREALELYDDLVLCGGIYYVNNEPAGFLLGEELNSTMFCLHFAKGKRKFKGLYQYMFNQFANILPQKYEWINLEQDMGILALKTAKASYDPDVMVEKFRVKIG
ncbi:MAG: DUF2156 domain-containing protein [Candidatus Omnitrophica bacterium]|nr:DUF2156 domain-containing protein [Candidatus Omnitrophota bacterium]